MARSMAQGQLSTTEIGCGGGALESGDGFRQGCPLLVLLAVLLYSDRSSDQDIYFLGMHQFCDF